MYTVYLETSVWSYLTANPSKNLIAAAKQQLTFEWWEKHFEIYELYVSDAVLVEAAQGDSSAAQKRLKILKNIPRLQITNECLKLAEEFYSESYLPVSARDDALHAAIATQHNIDFLLTWNCRHLANAHFVKKLVAIADRYELRLPQICTPEELMGDE